MKLVVAEKPSVGKAYASVLGATESKSGYMEGNGYIVSWCFGHLVELFKPDDYTDDWGGYWRYDTLPMIPTDWKHKVSESSKEQYKVLESLMCTSDIDEVICGTDAGREGELIFRLVYLQSGCMKPMKRLWISSMEDSAIREGFANLKAGSEYDNLYQSALCRSKADWLVGMNGTRLFTVLYKKLLNVGRVQTPTLAMLVEREDKIQNFVKESYYKVHLHYGEFDAVTDKISEKNKAEEIMRACHNRQALVTSVTKENKSVASPKLYDLTSLQRDANRLFGFTAKKVGEDTEKQKDVFYGNNAYIYNLTYFKEFKSLEQKLAVFGALNTPEGYTTLVSLPTGGGKSLITQTMAYQQEGLTIVIVPTVSLAIDQVRNAKNNVKHNADNEIFCYYSGIELERKNALRNAIKAETARMLFISPEALIRNTEFVNMINEANAKKYLKNLIVDEAHIVIEWGDFFRVDYQCLEPWRNELLVMNSQLRTVLLSATYTKTAVMKLKQMFATTGKWIEIRCDALRHEPRYLIVKAKSYSDKKRKMIELVKKLPHPMVVYINSPKEAEEIKKTLISEGLNNLETFTGNTKSAERERIIKDWTDNKIDLIIATSAFGVGVDKGDVRTVLHLYIPDTPNQYYQELGRGGRDGLESLSVMCINPVDDIDSAYKRMNKVLSADKIWGRWLSMYTSKTSLWFKGMVTLDTAVKPIYNVTKEDDDASDIDIQWNVYVILLLRRHNLISIKSMIYDSKNECYKIRVDILDDALRNESADVPVIIKEIRDRESEGFERELKRIKNGIDFSNRICWSEMFYSTYDKVSMYCGGCEKHKYPEMMEEGKFPLLLPVKEPKKQISPELNKLCQGENEVLVIGEEDDYSLMNRYVSAGASVIVIEDTGIEDDFDLILNMSKQSNIMVLGIKEYRELCMQGSGYYVSGGVVALYNSGADKAYEFCSILRKYKNKDIKLIHIVKEDYFIQKAQKPISAMVEGPKIDSYILERM